MKERSGFILRTCALLSALFWGTSVAAQSPNTTGNPGQPTTISNAPQRDTNANKSNTNKWKNVDAQITYVKLNSARVYVPDTGLHTFQRNPFLGEWYRDLGNEGSPANNLFFTPEYRTGPTLGYHVFDVYRLDPEELAYYNTTRPYSDFRFSLGSKLEQYVSIMHTQNIKPNWNFAVYYRKLYSPGEYKIERNNDDNASITTNYLSLSKHYQLSAAMVYNKEQHDENGGIVDVTQLQNPLYGDKSTVDEAYENDAYSTTRSSVYNVQRDFTLLLQHSYTWGNMDTLYNLDSTQYTYRLHARFSISHKLELSTEKHTYTDESPDSLRYITLFQHSFINNGSGYYTPGVDSVVFGQKWFWVDNKFLLNGFVGKEGNQLKFSAGFGTRYDEFISQPARERDSVNGTTYTLGLTRNVIISNYAEGQLLKEALQAGEWEYGGNLKFFLTGQYAGDLQVSAYIGRQLKGVLGNFKAGFQQQVNSAPYSYTNYANQDTTLTYSFRTETVNELYATLESPRFRLSGGVKNYLINNYIYIDQNEVPAQYNIPFTISQAWIRKTFKVGHFYLDNELAYQQIPISAPVNVPALMGRHQLSYEYALFHNRLKVATGAEVRYNSSYRPAGYDALLNKFFYQGSTYVSNPPELALFVNFRIKRFRAFIMGDNLQQVFFRNTILYVGTPVVNFSPVINAGNPAGNFIPVYAAPDALLRFGFSWVLID